ncbi:CcdB family protein [Sphingomonas sp. ASY06-1R]|uniref:CcdB family protein n=1 Tax=Sphingomonas sp. ASY06-1R TaxID=3445771 RepID=UPI003FA1B4C8
MARLDVHARLDGGAGYLLDVQADLLSGLNTRLVVPLLPLDQAPAPAARLNPVFDIAGRPHVMVTQFAAAVHIRELGERVAVLSDAHEIVTAALDLLITGV